MIALRGFKDYPLFTLLGDPDPAGCVFAFFVPESEIIGPQWKAKCSAGRPALDGYVGSRGEGFDFDIEEERPKLIADEFAAPFEGNVGNRLMVYQCTPVVHDLEFEREVFTPVAIGTRDKDRPRFPFFGWGRRDRHLQQGVGEYLVKEQSGEIFRRNPDLGSLFAGEGADIVEILVCTKRERDEEYEKAQED